MHEGAVRCVHRIDYLSSKCSFVVVECGMAVRHRKVGSDRAVTSGDRVHCVHVYEYWRSHTCSIEHFGLPPRLRLAHAPILARCLPTTAASRSEEQTSELQY